MPKLWKKIIGFGFMVVLLAPSLALAAGPAAAPLVVVADNRRLTGWEAWWANLYNESHVLFHPGHRGLHPHHRAHLRGAGGPRHGPYRH